MTQPDTTTMLLLYSLPVLGYIGGRLLEVVFVRLWRWGKAPILFTDWDSGLYGLKWVKIEGNEFTRGKGESARRYILDARARLNGRLGPMTMAPLWIVLAETGLNLAGPKDDLASYVPPVKTAADVPQADVPTQAALIETTVGGGARIVSLVGPTHADIQSDPVLRKMTIPNPNMYFQKLKTNHHRQALTSNHRGPDKWAQLAPWMLLGLVVVMIGVGVIAWKLFGDSSGAA